MAGSGLEYARRMTTLITKGKHICVGSVCPQCGGFKLFNYNMDCLDCGWEKFPGHESDRERQSRLKRARIYYRDTP